MAPPCHACHPYKQLGFCGPCLIKWRLHYCIIVGAQRCLHKQTFYYYDIINPSEREDVHIKTHLYLSCVVIDNTWFNMIAITISAANEGWCYITWYTLCKILHPNTDWLPIYLWIYYFLNINFTHRIFLKKYFKATKAWNHIPTSKYKTELVTGLQQQSKSVSQVYTFNEHKHQTGFPGSQGFRC